MTRSRAKLLRWLGSSLALASMSCAGHAPVTQRVQGSRASRSNLVGHWSEFWSLTGQAESQRYAFSANGEFRWTAPPSVSAPAAGTPLSKVGQFDVKPSEHGRTLILHVAATELAGCDSACDAQEARAFHVDHKPALLEQIELGDCPPNLEAQQVDAQYACVALGARTFWRRPARSQTAAERTGRPQ